jgi:hypothetical protein
MPSSTSQWFSGISWHPRRGSSRRNWRLLLARFNKALLGMKKIRRKYLSLATRTCVQVGMRLEKLSVWPWLLIACFWFGLVAHAQSPADEGDNGRDVLVYKDGDRVRGHVVTESTDLIVFKSDRFGELRVRPDEVVIIKAEKPQGAVTKQVVAAGIRPLPTPAERREQEKVSIWERFSPAVLTARVRNFFGPWHGRLAVSDEVVTDTAHRNAIAVEAKLKRTLEKDVVELTSRYDYDRTDDVKTTDLLKSTGSWRHDFNRMQFTQYRPTLEWNRANRRPNAANEYVLLQQELGFGFNVLSKPARKLRLGLSENLFDTWSSGPGSSHSSRAVESLFDEAEFALPWRMALTQRGVWYPMVHNSDGWEDQIELNKKLTETLSVALRHEIRRHNPDGASQDYTRLKLLLGLDF